MLGLLHWTRRRPLIDAPARARHSWFSGGGTDETDSSETDPPDISERANDVEDDTQKFSDEMTGATDLSEPESPSNTP